jgi:hypothetical protein
MHQAETILSRLKSAARAAGVACETVAGTDPGEVLVVDAVALTHALGLSYSEVFDIRVSA